jgi:hypothetical protein
MFLCNEGTYGSFKTSLLFERIKKWINTSLFGKQKQKRTSVLIIQNQIKMK